MPSPIPEIRETVARLRAALLEPGLEPVVRMIPELEACAAALHAAGQQPQEQELLALKQELSRAGALIVNAMAFQAGWARILGSAAGGYRASGDAAPLPAARPNVSIAG